MNNEQLIMDNSKLKKGYKNTEVGVIPEEWEVKCIFEAFDICNKLRLPISEEVRKTMQGIFPYYGPTRIQDYINEYRVNGEYALIGEDGDHFLKWQNNPMTQLAKGKFNVNNHAHLLKGKNGISTTEWFYHYFKHSDITQHLTRQGAGRYKLSKASLVKIPCAIPNNIEEQTAIATVLSDTDNLIQALEKKIAKKRLIKQGAMQKLLAPKEGWERIKLDEVIEVNRGGSPRPIHDYLTSSPNGINWIKIGDTSPVSKYIIESKEKIISDGVKNSREVKVGDFLLSNSMSFGRPYILKIDGCIHDGWLVLQNYQNSFDKEFLYYTLMSKDVFNQYLSKASGSGVLNLNKELVKTVELNRPTSIKEQTHIATILSDMDTEIEALENKLAKYKEIKQGLMQNLLTGKIRLV